MMGTLFSDLALGFQAVMQPHSFLALAGGVMLGLIVGVIPGLNDSIAISILIPITFVMEPLIGLIMLVGIYVASCYGGSFAAILVGIPGTASSVVTTQDGYPMTQKGLAGQALSISTASSVFGGIFSTLVLMFAAPWLAKQALRFGPAEYFALAVFGLSTIAGMGGSSILRSLISGVLGLLISTIGMSPQLGYPRFYFGNANLLDGIPFVPALIGLFGITSIMGMASSAASNGQKSDAEKVVANRIGSFRLGRDLVHRLLPVWLISAVLGTCIGIIPGAGMIMAVYLAYEIARRRTPGELEFGTGIPEGIAAPETANNATVGGSMVPLLSLGVPGNSTSALFLGALMIHGLRPGPMLFIEQPVIGYGILAAFLIGNILMGGMGLLVARFMSGLLLSIPQPLLGGAVAAFCAVGSFSMGNNIFNVLIMLIFGVLGFAMKKLDLPMSPMILAMVLGTMAESSLQQALVISRGSYSIFYTRPIALGLLIVAAWFFFVPIVQLFISRIRATGKSAAR